MTAPIRFYNPREASAEVLEAMLVGRETIVQEILDDLSRQAGSVSRQHWLVRGPRGIGKTHLVAVLYHRIRRDPYLSRAYLPVWLPEAEAYSVYSAGVLLVQVVEQLAAELRSLGDPRAAKLQAEIEQSESGGDDPALLEEMAELLRQESRRCGKTLVVLMENLDALLAGFSARRSAQEAQRLRSILSEDKELLFLSTTPTRYLTDLSDPKKPLYGQLKERSLQPLSEEEVGQLLEGLAHLTGRAMAEPGSSEEEQARLRRRVLHRLTGGNPRAVVMAYSVLSGTPGVRGMVEEMSALLDAQTAYFEARLAQLAPRERAIVTAMALARENLTLQEIAQLTRLPLRSLSTQVDRLIEQGFVMLAHGERGKGVIYELSDGLFRIWCQYRKGRKILEPIINFLALWHPVEELERTLSELRSSKLAALGLLEQDILRSTELQIEEALAVATSERGRTEKEKLWRECAASLSSHLACHEKLADITGAFLSEDYKAAQDAINELCDLQKRADLPGALVAMSSLLIALALLELGRRDEGIYNLQEITARFKDNEDRLAKTAVQGAHISLCILLTTDGHYRQSIEHFKKGLGFPNKAVVLDAFRRIALPALAHNEDTSAAYKLLRNQLHPIKSDDIDEATRQTLLIAHTAAWESSLFAGQIAEAEDYISEWIEVIRLYQSPGALLPQGLRAIVEYFPTKRAKRWIAFLEASRFREVSETAHIYSFVLDLLESDGLEADKRSKGAVSQIRRTLSRVPRELRQDVEDAFKQIRAIRLPPSAK